MSAPLQSAPLLRAQRCGNCKFREIGTDGKARCHEGPPQRAAFMVPGKERLVLQVDVAFPDVHDDWFCHRWKPRIAAH